MLLGRNNSIMRLPMATDCSNYKARIMASGGTISSASLVAHNKFVKTLKSASIWDKLSEICTYSGNNLNAALVKLKYPSEIQSTLTNFNFTDSDYSENSGLNGNGLTKYLKTGWIASQQLASSFNAHISLYCRNQLNISLSLPVYLGALSGARFFIRRTPGSLLLNNRIDSFIGSGTENNAYMSSSSGFICASNDNHNSGKLYMNAELHNSDSSFTTEARTNIENYIFALNSSGSATNFSNAIICFHSFGLGLTASEITILNNAVQALQVALGRTV